MLEERYLSARMRSKRADQAKLGMYLLYLSLAEAALEERRVSTRRVGRVKTSPFLTICSRQQH
jgi:hypothetical protein